MGLKVLGLLCAGVFFGAAILEVKQMAWRKKGSRRTAAKQPEADAREGQRDAEDTDGAKGDRT